MIYLIGVRIDNKYGIHVDKDGSFTGSEDYETALKCLPDYRENHLRSYESGMSAVVYQLSFGLNLLSFKDMDEVKKAITGKVHFAHNISGNMHFTPLKDGYTPNVAHSGKFLPDDMKG